MSIELTWLQSQALEIISKKELGDLLDTGEFENDTEEGIFHLLEINGVDVLQIEDILETLKRKRYIDSEFTITSAGEEYLQLKEERQEKMGTVNNISVNGNVEQLITEDNVTIDNSVKQNGVIVQGNEGGTSSGGLLEKGVKVISTVKDILDNKK